MGPPTPCSGFAGADTEAYENKKNFEGLSPREVKRFLSRAIAVLLQRGNANILRQGLSYSSATARRVQ